MENDKILEHTMAGAGLRPGPHDMFNKMPTRSQTVRTGSGDPVRQNVYI